MSMTKGEKAAEQARANPMHPDHTQRRPMPMTDLTPLRALIERWKKEAKADRMAAALLGRQRATRHQADGVEDLAARSEKHADDLEAALAAVAPAPQDQGPVGEDHRRRLQREVLVRLQLIETLGHLATELREEGCAWGDDRCSDQITGWANQLTAIAERAQMQAAVAPAPQEPDSRLQALVERLENYYAFECEGGLLKFCVEWQQLKAALLAPAGAPPQEPKKP